MIRAMIRAMIRPLLPALRAWSFVVVAGLLGLALPSAVSAGIVTSPVTGDSPGLGPDRGDAVVRDAAARQVERAMLAERHARLQRDLAVLAAAERTAERHLRRLVDDFADLAAERDAAAALTTAREVEVGVRQQRLETLLAEIVQLSRDETGDARRLAQLRAVAAALAEPFAEARRAVAESRAVAEVLERREGRLRLASLETRRALAEAVARQAWLAAALDETMTLATEAAERAVAVERMATLTALRHARGEAGRALAALPAPAAVVPPERLEPNVRHLPQQALTARAAPVERAARPLAHFDLAPRTVLARGLESGQLLPVAGEVVARFGEGQRAPFDRGLTIEVEERRLVRAPRDGRVVFARAYEGFGLLLIIDHGNEYHSLLSGLSRFVVHEGWAVRAGQMVGTIEPGSEAVGRLYVELRRRGVPVDPFAWFAAGQDKVRS